MMCRPWGSPDFDPISTRVDRLRPPNYEGQPRNFRPSDGLTLQEFLLAKKSSKKCELVYFCSQFLYKFDLDFE